jgi:hypothetical protein
VQLACLLLTPLLLLLLLMTRDVAVAADLLSRLEFSPDSQDLWAVSSTTPSMQDGSSSGGISCSVSRFCASTGSLLQVGLNSALWLPMLEGGRSAGYVCRA